MAEKSVQILSSSPWTADGISPTCSSCRKEFDNFLQRRHHCRLCGNVFCNDCTKQRALIPPSSIVLKPIRKDADSTYLQTTYRTTVQSKANALNQTTIQEHYELTGDFDSSSAPGRKDSALLDDDLSLSVATSSGFSYTSTSELNQHYPHQYQNGSSELSLAEDSNYDGYEAETVLYGKGLEERMKLARDPLRVCSSCYDQLQQLQEELRNTNSHAMKYNTIDPTHIRRLLNSPLAFTLGHEIRKAAYTLNNLLPMPKRMGAFVGMNGMEQNDTATACQNTCVGIVGNFGNIDGVKIPAKLLEKAKGVAVMTLVKGGIGFAGLEFGTGLVVSRLGEMTWSPPCAIGTVGISWGALVGAQLTDHVFLLMTDAAVDIMSSNKGSFTLGADIGVALGPLGRSAEADVGASPGRRGMEEVADGPGGVELAPIYTYSLSKGFYAGVSLDGKAIVTRHRINENFYGQKVESGALLSGDIPTPPAAQPLYDALKRCHIYATNDD